MNLTWFHLSFYGSLYSLLIFVSTDALEFEHELNMNFDLGLSAKVQGAALKATTTVSAKALTIDQNVALQLSPTDKLQYQVYVHKTASGESMLLSFANIMIPHHECIMLLL